MILDKIVAHKRTELLYQQAQLPMVEVRRRAECAAPPLDFATALRGSDVRLIAEVKKASPSRGLLRADFDPVALAHTYATEGATAISVLTDEQFFQGNLDHLHRVRKAIHELPVIDPGSPSEIKPVHMQPGPKPLLRKDFTLDVYQIYEARAAGADAVLLIAAILEQHQIADFQTLAHELGMAVLIEIHDKGELDKAMWVSPHLVGVNNRDLHTFHTDLATCLSLRQDIPSSTIVVAESGISSRVDVEKLAGAGIDAILVGEALVTASDIAAKVQELTGVKKAGL